LFEELVVEINFGTMAAAVLIVGRIFWLMWRPFINRVVSNYIRYLQVSRVDFRFDFLFFIF